MNHSLKKIPKYLRKNVVEQDHDSYTPQHHATWRYIMRRARHFFKSHAVPCYEKGLKKTGITLHRIPSINEIDERLNEFGWGAIGVCGFIPPAAFVDFQARHIMPIAMDMRSIQHVAYTPAPDIVHEAAGHVPILIDPAFRNFLGRYARLADKAIITKEDVALYEAVRLLSDIKENLDTTPEEITQAEKALKKASDSITHLSEAAKMARLSWWTTEYGLVGNLKSPRIYGAGLLSSVGESENCLSSKVKKIPLTLECIEQAYDITEPQPQLFVAKSMERLPDILDDAEKILSFKTGGTEGLDTAVRSKTVNTVQFDSGIQLSGEITEYLTSKKGDLEFVKLSGPVQIAANGAELAGHSRTRHPAGFSSPLGRFKKFAQKKPQDLTNEDLAKIGLARGCRATLELESEFKVEGTLLHIYRVNGKLAILSWHDCRVSRGNQIYYEPSWGAFDQITGTSATSVFSGPADRDSYGEYETGNISTSPGRTSPYSKEEWALFQLYQHLRTLREGKLSDEAMISGLEKIANEYVREYKNEWLLGVELLEMTAQKLVKQRKLAWKALVEQAVQRFAAHGKGSDSHSLPHELIQHGLELVSVRD